MAFSYFFLSEIEESVFQYFILNENEILVGNIRKKEKKRKKKALYNQERAHIYDITLGEK